MLDAIISFFNTNIAGAENQPADSDHRLRIATAVLLVEVMYMDHVVEEAEMQTVQNIIVEAFSLSESEAGELMDLARREIRESTDYYQFTSLINKSLELSDKVQIIESLWKVAFADNQLDRYEEHMIRKVADLLYVPHREFIAAKHRADTRQTGSNQTS